VASIVSKVVALRTALFEVGVHVPALHVTLLVGALDMTSVAFAEDTDAITAVQQRRTDESVRI
jgi:hypothetical protein